jgi:hypothetical protein
MPTCLRQEGPRTTQDSRWLRSPVSEQRPGASVPGCAPGALAPSALAPVCWPVIRGAWARAWRPACGR